MAIYYEFCRRDVAVLFATDIAARGLDFPAVDWIVQVDCPDDVDTYIHRVGRTARFRSKGNALLLLVPSERVFLEMLAKAKVPITETNVNQSK
jgi:ATP-dependent RNA helicase DDX10/DBP4